ncbi:MAG: biotin attachment protein [Brevibacterium sp.]|uniref:biotin/lipoyl-containing protein n=1 Tax=Brevibacterium sp. TaxID=1701 RepID=UPI0026478A50|nr:biotin/lipoyl-containing protein [Brevibacterium sp.]MDN5808397.1 biotin attachment protein [Brevibacterium sp.]MDN5833893.1 biotin attachment protein [Brevibacterium sp.]MDN5877164.1 biotin attachment protein [Brevibacterium sp.]MDN5908937.1 biotin attachment protein [Brevibacterium sp.]MDN6157944.1 biotin attachment protein [Brevibacterium sp.]
MTEIAFPTLSENSPGTEGVVSTWFAEDGSSVAAGDLVAEVAVDKVDAEVTAPESGTLTQVVAEGGVTTQGSVIGTIATD